MAPTCTALSRPLAGVEICVEFGKISQRHSLSHLIRIDLDISTHCTMVTEVIGKHKKSRCHLFTELLVLTRIVFIIHFV